MLLGVDHKEDKFKDVFIIIIIIIIIIVIIVIIVNHHSFKIIIPSTSRIIHTAVMGNITNHSLDGNEVSLLAISQLLFLPLITITIDYHHHH